MKFAINSLYSKLDSHVLLAQVTINGKASEQLYNCLPQHLVKGDAAWGKLFQPMNRTQRRASSK